MATLTTIMIEHLLEASTGFISTEGNSQKGSFTSSQESLQCDSGITQDIVINQKKYQGAGKRHDLFVLLLLLTRHEASLFIFY